MSNLEGVDVRSSGDGGRTDNGVVGSAGRTIISIVVDC